jgi:bacteriocin-like protein
MLMKYKDFKMLSENEMKKIKGGDAPPDGDEGGGSDAGCPTSCTKKVGNTTYIGSCKKAPNNIGCYCSQSGGSGCAS